MSEKIQFFNEDISFTIKHKGKIRSWINRSAKSENRRTGFINIILCSDRYLLSINKRHLNHNTFTDIITFQYNEADNELSGDIYISIERVKENAEIFKQSFETELARVIIHGILHLAGYQDCDKQDKVLMRQKEDLYLSQRFPDFS